MENVWVQRDASGVVKGVYALQQPGIADESLPGDDAAVVSFLNPKPVIAQVSPRQARLALLQAGLLDKVQAAVQTAGGAVQIEWEYASVFERNDPLVLSIGSSLNLTSSQLDDLFKLAVTL